MAESKADVLMVGPMAPFIMDGISKAFTLHKLWEAKDRDAMIADLAPNLRLMAAGGGHARLDGSFLSKFPKLELVSSFGVGYDHIDAKWAGAHGIVVTNTPDVLTEEVADTAMGLLLSTVREFPQAERYLRAGQWPKAPYPLTKGTLRESTVGIVGLGRIGKAIARRLEASDVTVAYFGRNRQADVSYRYYSNLVEMARAVDVLMVVTPGGPETKNLINAAVLEALGPDGVLINVARGSVVDEPALIKALKEKKIRSAGLDVFVDEPQVPKELIEMEHIVLFPHLGSASIYTREKMGQLVIDNLVAWAAGKPPLTPVAETPVKQR